MKKISKLLFLCSIGALALPMIGCDKNNDDKKPSITLKCESEVSELERHESLQFTVDLLNVEENSVSYKVSSEVATIDETGKLTVKDDAVVGTEFKVSAESGNVKSNEFTFTVKDTIASQISIQASQTSVIEGEEVSFELGFYPSYATITDCNLTIVEGKEIAEIYDGKLSLKQGVSYMDHLGEVIVVRASLKAYPDVKKDISITVSDAEGTLDVAAFNIVARHSNTFNVSAIAYDGSGKKITGLSASDFRYSSSNTKVFIVSQDGVVTGTGHGTATLTVEYQELKTEVTVNVIVSPESITVEGLTQAIRDRHFKFAKGAEYVLNVTENKGTYENVSSKYTYDLKLFNENNELVTDKDEEIATRDGNKFVFLQKGTVHLNIISDSSLDNEDTSEYEYDMEKATGSALIFDVNEGVNISTYGELVDALQNPEVVDLNFVNNINVKNDEIERKSDGTLLHVESYGSKNFNGNGFEISLKAVDLVGTDITSDDSADSFIQCFPDVRGGENAHGVFTINASDISFIGNTDYNAKYNGTGNGEGQYAMHQFGNFIGGFRAALEINRECGPKDYVDYTDKTHSEFKIVNEDFSDSYNERPSFTNVRVDGFNFGLWARHMVDGTFTNFTSVNAAEKGLLLEQCTVELVNPTFYQNGAFCIELTQDGINNASNLAAPAEPLEGVDYSRHSTAASYYEITTKKDVLGRTVADSAALTSELHKNVPARTNMSGIITVNNYNSGAGTEYMKIFQLGLYGETGGYFSSLAQIINEVLLGTIEGIVGTKEGPAAQMLLNLANSMIYKNGDSASAEVNYFALSFLRDLELNKTGESPDNYTVIFEQGKSAVTMMELLAGIAQEYIQTGAIKQDYKSYKYIDFELNLGSNGHLGRAILVNSAYQGA